MKAGEVARHPEPDAPEIRYSICVTHRNCVETVRDSLDSIISQIDGKFEVVFVDARSNDGSEKILKDYHEKGKIKLITKKCSRGAGRQTALESARGEYIISHVDMDDVYAPRLGELIEHYHTKCEGRIMAAISAPGDWTQNVTMGPRDLILGIGGWSDLQYGDDWDLWSRAAATSKYSWTVFPMSNRHVMRKSRSGALKTTRFRFRKYRDGLRLGRDVFRKEEGVTLSQNATRLMARVSLFVYPAPLKGGNRDFRAADPACFVA